MNATTPHQATGNFLLNERGGITYSPHMPIGQIEARSNLLADVRVLADATADLCAAHRNFWPHPYPVPEDVHCALLAADYGLARVRDGKLKRLAEQDTAPAIKPDQHKPVDGPAHYRIDLSDLIHIADAATELDTMRAFLVDQHSEQQRIGHIVKRIYDLVEKAAGQHAQAIFDKPRPSRSAP